MARRSRSSSVFLERVVGDLTGGDRSVQLEQPPVRLGAIVRSAVGPAVGSGDGLVEPAMQVGEIAVSAVVHLVVEAGQADLTLETDLLPRRDDEAGLLGDRLGVLVRWMRPRECLECRGMRVANVDAQGRPLARPLLVNSGEKDTRRVIVFEGKDDCEIAWAGCGFLPRK